MIPGATMGAEPGHKTLAAIVFTDVVGFAHHANTDEPRALKNLQRDMDIMRDVCERTSGIVLKTMGDGMLMRFPSANQALQCALEIQRIFHEQSKRLATADILWHRIGVHLGDVVTTDSDVYGDGVNVAARLQAEAKPGSIYLSRTVYDVVKGKISLAAVYVGPRHLKGIAEPVAVWEVPPLGKQEMDKRQAVLTAMNAQPNAEVTTGLRGPRAVALVVASVLLLGAASGMLVMSARRAANEKLVSSGKTLHLKLDRDKPAADPNAPAAVSDTTQPPQDQQTEGVQMPTRLTPGQQKQSGDPADDADLQQQLKSLFARYDFPGMEYAIQGSRYSQTDWGKSQVDRYAKLNGFMGWLNDELDLTSQDHYITISSDPEHGNVPADIYRTGSGMVAIHTANGDFTVAVNKLTAMQIAAISGALADFGGSQESLSRGEIERDAKWLVEDYQHFNSAAPSPSA